VKSIGNPFSEAPRLTKTCVCLPIVYGSMAFPLKKVEEYNTHQWTLYLRGPAHEDLSNAIARVIFQLHPSFAQPVRELTQPPYEVTEKGWGEFDVTIKVVWRDESEKPLILTTPLKLYAYPGMTAIKEGEPVIYEVYDEVVFTDPLEKFYNQLMSGQQGSLRVPKIYSNDPNVQERFPSYSDEEDVKALLEAQKFLSMELCTVKDRIIKAKQAQEELDQALVSASTLKKGSPGPAAKSYKSETKIGTINNNINSATITGSNVKSPTVVNKPPTKRMKKSVPTMDDGDNK
jgi:YEATS domain-containing protein 4